MGATPESLSEKLDTLYSSTWQLLRNQAVDNIFKATPLFYWLYSKNRVRRETGGRWIGAQLLYGKNTSVKSIGIGGALDIINDEIVTTAKYDWKWLACNVVRYFGEDNMNSGKSALMNLVNAKLKTAELSMIDKMETMAWAAAPGADDFNSIVGTGNSQCILKASFTSDVLGGIDAATNTWWQNQYKDCTATAGDTIAELKNGLNNLYNTTSVGNDHPDIIMGYQLFYEWYENWVLQPILRVYDTKLGDVGFEGLKYKGAVLTFSPTAVDAKVAMLNSRYLEMVIDTNADFFMTQWKPIPNQLDRVAQIVLQGNVITTNRRMQGLLGTPAGASLPVS